MARKLKTYQTSIGFFDLVIAAPSMKAALEAWGANSNLFHQGFAQEVDDEDTVAAALKKPGVILRRPVGTAGPYTEHPDLPDDLPRGNAKSNAEKPAAKHRKPRPPKEVDDKAARKAALAFEREQERRENERRKADAAEGRERGRRERSVDKAQAAIDDAASQHENLASAIEERRRALEAKAKEEDERWMQQKLRLEAALERAKRF
jgi:colicin import membrane protein